MNKYVGSAGLAASLMLCAGPCLAADDMKLAGAAEYRMGAFAGARIHLPLGQKRPVLQARLQLTTTYSLQDRQTASFRTIRPGGIELGSGPVGKSTLFLNGHDIRQGNQKLGLGRTETILLIAGGVLVAGAAAFLLLSDCDACKSQPL